MSEYQEKSLATATAHLEEASKQETNVDDVTVQIAVSDKDQATIRKLLDRKMLPVVCTLYVLSYLDRGNIGNAKTAGAQTDLKISSDGWTWVLNAFYIAYTLMEWTVMLWKLLPAHLYVAGLCVLWGVAAACSGATTSMGGLIACRVCLGVFEASFGAGAPYYLSLFYQRRELAFRVSLLLGMSPLANCFAGALAYGITQISGGLAPWRYLFIIEGIPTIAFAPVVFFFLPDAPNTARFFTETQKRQAVDRLQTRDLTAKTKVQWNQFFAGIMDYRNFMHTMIHFMCNYSFAGLSNFLPTIIQGLGYTSINAQGLTAPVYFASFLLCVLAAVISDRYGRRAFIIAAFATIGCIGYLILAVVEDKTRTNIRYLGVWLAVCGIFPALCINLTWLMNNNSSDSKRGAGLALAAIIGQCSSFLSSAVFPSGDAPYYTKGCAIGCGFTGSIVVLAMALYFRLLAINKRKDREFGPVAEDEQYDITKLGDKHPAFRYQL